MANVELVVKIPKEYYEVIKSIPDNQCTTDMLIIKNGKLLPKGHGRIVDIGKIDNDKIERDNPIICLTVNGEYIEAISLDYLNNLPTIIEADKESEDKK